MKRSTRNDLKRTFNDGCFNRQKASMLIDGLWRDHQLLYEELGLSKDDFKKADPEQAEYDERYVFTKNTFHEEIDNKVYSSWATMLGYGHKIHSDFAQVFGYFNSSTSYHETIFGVYAKELESSSADTWVMTDPLFRIGNGLSSEDRSDAFLLCKDGYAEFINSIVLGPHSHGEIVVKDGTLQFSNGELSYYYENEWHTIGVGGLPEGVKGNILYYNEGWQLLAPASDGDSLVLNTGIPQWKFLVPGCYSKGALLYGNANLKWDHLLPGNEGYVLSVGADQTLQWIKNGQWNNSATGIYYSTGSVGINTGGSVSYGLSVHPVNAGGSCIYAITDGSGIGISSTSVNGSAIVGTANYGSAIVGNSQFSYGIYGNSTENYGVYGFSSNAAGVKGDSTNGYGGQFGGRGVYIQSGHLFIGGAEIIDSSGNVKSANGFTGTGSYTTLTIVNGIITSAN